MAAASLTGLEYTRCYDTCQRTGPVPCAVRARGPRLRGPPVVHGRHPLEVVAIEVLRVSGTSRPNAVAGAIAALLPSEGEGELQAIGPQAVNQAVKGLAIARGYVAENDLDLTTAPSFVTLELHDEERTALRFHVQAVPLGQTPHPGLSNPD